MNRVLRLLIAFLRVAPANFPVELEPDTLYYQRLFAFQALATLEIHGDGMLDDELGIP